MMKKCIISIIMLFAVGCTKFVELPPLEVIPIEVEFIEGDKYLEIPDDYCLIDDKNNNRHFIVFLREDGVLAIVNYLELRK